MNSIHTLPWENEKNPRVSYSYSYIIYLLFVIIDEKNNELQFNKLLKDSLWRLFFMRLKKDHRCFILMIWDYEIGVDIQKRMLKKFFWFVCVCCVNFQELQLHFQTWNSSVETLTNQLKSLARVAQTAVNWRKKNWNLIMKARSPQLKLVISNYWCLLCLHSSLSSDGINDFASLKHIFLLLPLIGGQSVSTINVSSVVTWTCFLGEVFFSVQVSGRIFIGW